MDTSRTNTHKDTEREIDAQRERLDRLERSFITLNAVIFQQMNKMPQTEQKYFAQRLAADVKAMAKELKDAQSKTRTHLRTETVESIRRQTEETDPHQG